MKKTHRRNQISIIGVLTKCDELPPPTVYFPTNNERKNENLKKVVQDFKDYLRENQDLRASVKDVIPTVAYAEYEEGKNGLILPDSDLCWNIDKLVETMIKYTPRETHGSFARMAHLAAFQLTIARTMVTACSTINAVISGLNPIPGASMPPVAAIQTFLIMYIAWLSGREFSQQSIQEFGVFLGVSAGANAGMIGIADIALKFLPGVGNLVAAGAALVATQGIGDTAIKYFLNNGEV